MDSPLLATSHFVLLYALHGVSASPIAGILCWCGDLFHLILICTGLLLEVVTHGVLFGGGHSSRGFLAGIPPILFILGAFDPLVLDQLHSDYERHSRARS
mgnify:CR=1 FL=1